MNRKQKIALFSAFVMVILYCSLTFPFSKAITEGKSMEPTLHTGDIVFRGVYEDVNQDLTGRIITYDLIDKGVCHRVIKDEGEIVYCLGDNNINPDNPVMRSQITGVVSFYVPSWFFAFEMMLILGVLCLGMYMISESINNENR